MSETYKPTRKTKDFPRMPAEWDIPRAEQGSKDAYRYRDFAAMPEEKVEISEDADREAVELREALVESALLAAEHHRKECIMPAQPMMRASLSVRAQRFPVKLYAILAQPELNGIISWMPHGRSWKVHNPGVFESFVLPVFFDSDNYHSFNRVINAWSFRRISSGPDRGCYFHELFLRGKPHLQKYMRRLPKATRKPVMNKEDEPDFFALEKFSPLPTLIEADEEDARKRQERQERRQLERVKKLKQQQEEEEACVKAIAAAAARKEGGGDDDAASKPASNDGHSIQVESLRSGADKKDFQLLSEGEMEAKRKIVAVRASQCTSALRLQAPPVDAGLQAELYQRKHVLGIPSAEQPQPHPALSDPYSKLAATSHHHLQAAAAAQAGMPPNVRAGFHSISEAAGAAAGLAVGHGHGLPHGANSALAMGVGMGMNPGMAMGMNMGMGVNMGVGVGMNMGMGMGMGFGGAAAAAAAAASGVAPGAALGGAAAMNPATAAMMDPNALARYQYPFAAAPHPTLATGAQPVFLPPGMVPIVLQSAPMYYPPAAHPAAAAHHLLPQYHGAAAAAAAAAGTHPAMPVVTPSSASTAAAAAAAAVAAQGAAARGVPYAMHHPDLARYPPQYYPAIRRPGVP